MAACAICHEATPRAAMVSDLGALNYATSHDFWKTMAAAGVPNRMMPAFAAEHGGPLTSEQIDSLATMLTEKYPSRVPVAAPIKAAALKP